MIAVVDYKAGNLTSVMKAVRAVGADAVATYDPDVVRRATRLCFPGSDIFRRLPFWRNMD